MGLTEQDIYQRLYQGVRRLMELERQLSMPRRHARFRGREEGQAP
ncbi:hypothetical protein [Myxococcus stipitatus]